MPASTRPAKKAKSTKGKVKRALRPIADPKKRLAKATELLEANLGQEKWDGPRDALQVLVLTILSQNTTDPSALKAYIKLCETFPKSKNQKLFKNEKMIPRLEDGSIDPVKIRLSQAADAFFEPDWKSVVKATPKKLENTIRVAGLPNSKAPAILRALKWVKEESGEFSLEKTLEGLNPVEAATAMSALKGIGAKTAAVTLIEAMGVDLCPVDTHVHRILNRLAIVETKENRDKTYTLIQPMLPKNKGYALHHNLLTFGRTICTAKKPKCGECYLAKLCPSAQKQ